MSLAQDIETLESVPFFRRVDGEALRLIAFAAEARTTKPGDVLFRAGEASDGGYVVMSGAIRLEGDPAGPLVAEKGALIGELALIIDTQRPFTAIVSEAGHVLKISRGVFRRVLDEYPATADALHELIAGSMVDTVRGLAAVGRDLDAIG